MDPSYISLEIVCNLSWEPIDISNKLIIHLKDYGLDKEIYFLKE